MNKTNCPYCNQKAISYLEKNRLLSKGFLAPSGITICKHCNKTITVPKWTGFFDTVFFLIVLLSPLNDFYFRYIGIVIAFSCLILYSVFYLLFAPLIKYDN